MKLKLISAAVFTVLVSVPASASTIVLRMDGFATGERTVSRCGFDGPSCVNEVTPVAQSFSFDWAFNDIDWVDGLARFEFGHHRSSGVNSGTVRTSGSSSFTGLNYSYFLNIQDGRGCTTTCVLDATRMSASTFNVQQIIPAPVPEPATWAMMLVGFGTVGYSMRRKSKVNYTGLQTA